MHVVISILPLQLAQAESLLERIANLGGVSQFPCLIVSAGEQDLAKCHKLAASAFQSVTVLPVDMPPNYPSPANVLFTRAAYHMGMVVNDGYLYLEPDSYPTSPNWLKDIVFAYRENGCRFMGKLATMKLPPPLETEELYMMATGVYPANFYVDSDLIRQVPPNISADKFLQGEIVYRGKAHDSGLFGLGVLESRNAALVLKLDCVISQSVNLVNEEQYNRNRLPESVPVKTPESVMAAQAAVEKGEYYTDSLDQADPAYKFPSTVQPPTPHAHLRGAILPSDLEGQSVNQLPPSGIIPPAYEAQGPVQISSPIEPIPELHHRPNVNSVLEKLDREQPISNVVFTPKHRVSPEYAARAQKKAAQAPDNLTPEMRDHLNLVNQSQGLNRQQTPSVLVGRPSDDYRNPSVQIHAAPDVTTTFPADAKDVTQVANPTHDYLRNPQVLDPGNEALAAETIMPQPDAGHLQSYPQPVENVPTFGSEAERDAAIKADRSGGMQWRALLSKWRMTPKQMSAILNQV